MIKENKNKSRLNIKSKIPVLGLIIFIVLVGIFSPVFGVKNAEAADTCTLPDGSVVSSTIVPTAAACTSASGQWDVPGAVAGTSGNASTTKTNGLENNLPVCGTGGITLDGCLTDLFYYLFIPLTSLLLFLSGMLFNMLVALSLNSTMYAGSTFIPSAWAIVRDISNIFFILVLLYIAIRLILGLAGSDAKKMIVKVIIIALLINFSMFFTEVVIDASNILALVFYNKINVCTQTNASSVSANSTFTDPINCRPYIPGTNLSTEKDISGGFVSAFNPAKLLSQDFFTKASQKVVATTPASYSPLLSNIPGIGTFYNLYKANQIVGYVFGPTTQVPPSIMMGIIVVCGLIMLFAAYAFFIAAISFLGRLIELWILIIFSPFAFMSSTITPLEGIDYIGWKSWIKRLMTIAFMAPIFMFFMYVIFLIIHANIFGTIMRDPSGVTETWQEMLVSVLINGLILLILLIKAADFAKKGAGKLGEVLIKGAEIAMGVVAGVSLGVAAKGLQMTAGQAASRLANNERLKDAESRGVFGAGILRNISKYGAKSSFDVRQGAVGGVLAAAGGISGLNLGHSSKLFKEAGGFEADKKKRSEARVARAKELELGESSAERQAVRAAENNLAAAKSNPDVQARLVRLDEGDHGAENVARANLAAANAAPVGLAIQNLTAAQQGATVRLTAADAALLANPTNTGLQAAQKAAADQLDAANTTIATAQTLARNQVMAQDRLNAANAALALDPADHDLQAAQLQAVGELTRATTAVGTNAAAQEMLTKETALAEVAAAQGLGPLTRAATAAQEALVKAKRKLDTESKKYGENSLQASRARAEEAEAQAENDRTKTNLLNREADKRGAGGGIHRAEVNLKIAQNTAIAGSNTRRLNYANVVENSVLQNLAFVNAGGRWALGGTAQTETADKIRAGVQAEQKIPSAH